MKKICCFVLALLLCMSLLPAAVLADEPEALAEDNTMLNFCVDVQAGDDCYAPVLWAYLNGITDGVDNVHFKPDATISRADATVMLYRFAQRLGLGFTGAWAFPLSYGDATLVPDYAYEAVAWCGMNGIVEGYNNGKFGPGDRITREQFAMMLYRFAKVLGEPGFTGAWVFPLDYADAASVSQWADEAMHWCVMKGVIGGRADGSLAPKGQATRAEVVTMLCSFCTALYGGEAEQGGSVNTASDAGVAAVSGIQNAADSLQGKIAGVNVTNDSGVPGGGATIRIRGGSSLNASNDPLIVIDGVPNEGLTGKIAGVQVTAVDDKPGSGAQIRVRGYSSNSGELGPLYIVDGVAGGSSGFLNPADIESIEVLKDAAPAAIYGAEAGN